MQQVRFVRHGESAANAGHPSRDHESIPLTALGLHQAQMVASSFSIVPDLIVASPFTRAQATALATAAVFPRTPVETWPIQEFTYLEPTRCIDTTVAQRKGWVNEYWLRADPAHRDGCGAESFLDFVARARACLNRLAQHSATEIVMFSHGQFLNAIAWLLEAKPQLLDGRAMADWRRYEIDNHIPNCCGLSILRSAHDVAWTFGQRNY